LSFLSQARCKKWFDAQIRRLTPREVTGLSAIAVPRTLWKANAKARREPRGCALSKGERSQIRQLRFVG
jgi:hypothetical protein